MAYLHLPAQHSTGDLVLAGQIAEAFQSQDLFVTWTNAHGPSARPTVHAVVRDAPPHPIVEALRVLTTAVADAWRAMIGATASPQSERRAGTRQAA